MTNTIYFSKDEVKQALINYVRDKSSNINVPRDISFIGFLDKSEKNIDVELVQVFFEIE